MKQCQILIAGGGPAGLTAGLYAARAGKSVVVLEKAAPGGQIIYAPTVENYPGIPEMKGSDFAGALAAQTEASGAKIFCEEVLSALPAEAGRPCKVVTDAGEYECGALILATGTEHRKLGLPGEDELLGAGVSYCALCDGPFYSERRVAVVGGGNSAAQEALFLSEICAEVTLIHRKGRLRADTALVRRLEERGNIRILYHTVIESLIEQDGMLRSLKMRTGDDVSLLDIDGLFVAVGQVPGSAAFANLGITDETGFFRANETTETAVPGIFAAGDCRAKNVRQLTTACADGAAAASAACAYLDSVR